ncbi:hypothetical protein EB118_20975 [bacterium]|nr:hypothetical protein [bacterium]
MKWPVLDYQKIGIQYTEQLANNIIDANVRMFVTNWFWPYFVVGNLDSWQKLGITLNGARPIRC